MAVAPSSRISVDDLNALADLANSKVSADRYSDDVIPMNYDGSGNKYGYRILTSVALDPANLGANYELGDIVGGPAGSSFSICSVSSIGQALGLKIISPGQLGYPAGGDPTSPFALTGGSGAGAKITFVLSQIGPSKAYGFEDYFLGRGVITAFVVINGGVGFQVGDVLALPSFAGVGVTVNTVDAAGKILTSAAAGGAFLGVTTVLPTAVSNQKATGGHGVNAVLAALYTMPQIPAWATELSRMRKNISAFSAGLPREIMSGPWPLGNGTAPNNRNATDIVFYYANANPNQSVTISVTTFAPFGEEWFDDLIAGNPPVRYTKLTFLVVVGGDKNCVLNGPMDLLFDFVPGSSTTPTMTCVTNAPGVAFTLQAAGGGLARYRSTWTNQAVAPDTYKFEVTVTNGYFHYNSLDGTAVVLTYAENAHSPADGISKTYDVNKIVAPVTPDADGGWPFGLWGKSFLPVDVYPGVNQQTRFVQMFDLPPGYGGAGVQWIYWQSTFPALLASCAGLWLGNTSAVSDLRVPSPGNMPWNYARTKAKNIAAVGHPPDYITYVENPMMLGNSNPDTVGPSNTYDQATPVEGQMEPPRWAANRWVTGGHIIADEAGIAIFKCTTAGYTGNNEPGWNYTLNGTTNEAHDVAPHAVTAQWATWTCIKIFKDPDTWATNTTYSVGQTIADANGNTQQLISGWNPKQSVGVGDFITDDNNNTQQVITAGRTGLTKPNWSGVLNGTTNDGTAVWKLVVLGSSSVSNLIAEPDWGTKLGDITIDASCVWRLIKTLPERLRRALHRANPVPRYPFYWDSETFAALKPPTTNAEAEKTIWGCGNQWQHSSYFVGVTVRENGWQEDNQAFGWWLYSISINRITPLLPNISDAGNVGMGSTEVGMGDDSIGMGGVTNANPLEVTIGCIRNGVFVSFGTFYTGETVQVRIPVLTSDALVYQATERVDIQATAIGVGATGVGVGLGDVGSPSSATFFNDTETLLQLINP